MESVRTGLETAKILRVELRSADVDEFWASISSSLGVQGVVQQPAYATAFGFVFGIVGRHHSALSYESAGPTCGAADESWSDDKRRLVSIGPALVR